MIASSECSTESSSHINIYLNHFLLLQSVFSRRANFRQLPMKLWDQTCAYSWNQILRYPVFPFPFLLWNAQSCERNPQYDMLKRINYWRFHDNSCFHTFKDSQVSPIRESIARKQTQCLAFFLLGKISSWKHWLLALVNYEAERTSGLFRKEILLSIMKKYTSLAHGPLDHKDQFYQVLFTCKMTHNWNYSYFTTT